MSHHHRTRSGPRSTVSSSSAATTVPKIFQKPFQTPPQLVLKTINDDKHDDKEDSGSGDPPESLSLLADSRADFTLSRDNNFPPTKGERPIIVGGEGGSSTLTASTIARFNNEGSRAGIASRRKEEDRGGAEKKNAKIPERPSVRKRRQSFVSEDGCLEASTPSSRASSSSLSRKRSSSSVSFDDDDLDLLESDDDVGKRSLVRPESRAEKKIRLAEEQKEIEGLMKRNKKKVRRCLSMCLVPIATIALLRRALETMF